MTPYKQTNRLDPRTLTLSALALFASATAFAQEVKPADAQANALPKEDGEETIVLTPFNVDSSKDSGYFAGATLAGSRMNTNVADLGAAISVITKQQLEDTASVDINDVFRYEINTEGSSTYTPSVQSLRSDGVVDVNSGVAVGGGVVQTNATANRIRGIGTPSTAINYYPSVSAVPMDAYNISSLEINRGPNSMLFGMGSPAGIVNQTYAQAVVNRDFASIGARTDSNGSMRGSFSFNKGVLRDKIAIYGAAVYDDRQFQRKPSYDDTTRFYGAVTFKPFKKTTIRASAESYDNDNRRPNTLTPRDFVTQWNLGGRPIYDSLARTITQTDTGKVTGKYVINASSPYAGEVRSYIESMPGYNPALWNSAKTAYNGFNVFGEAAATTYKNVTTGAINPLFGYGIGWTNQARAAQIIQDGEMKNWFQPLYGQRYRTAWGTATNPSASAPLFPATESSIWASPVQADVYNRDYSSSAGWTAPINVGSYKYPGVTDKSIYNWDDININQMNFGEAHNKTYNVELEQSILDDLYVSAGWFRQNYESKSNYTVAQLNVATLFVDTNKYLPDGSPNPYVGKVYVEDSDPDQSLSTTDSDQYRVMLAYTPDFSQNKNWTKWFGRHQILGLWSNMENMTSFVRRRLEYIDSSSNDGKYRYMANQNANADGSPTGYNFQTTSIRRAFYLANPDDASGVVTRSSGEWNANAQSGDIKVYDYATNSFKTVNMSMVYNDFDASTGRNQTELESLSAGLTSYLWNERLVTTLGIRRDEYKARATTNAAILNADKTVAEPAMTNQQKWVNGIYQTQTVFNRWNRWDELSGETSTLGGVLRPFQKWNRIEDSADRGNLFWQFVRDFGFSYNKSDNFNPPSSAQVDAFGNTLPKPTGEGKDYGIQFSLLDRKLFAKLTWFEATNMNERTNPGSSISRLTGNVDTTLFRNYARTIAMINMGMDPRLDTFGTNLSANEEAAVKAAAEKIWQQSYTYYDDVGNIWATRNAEAEGMELELNYNPTKNWTMRVTAGKQETKYSDVLKEFSAWYDYRSPVWDKMKGADWLLPQYQGFVKYTRTSGRAVDLTNFWDSYGYTSEIRLDEPSGNYNARTYYNNVVAPQAALARDLDGQAAPGQRKYRWSFMTNYTFSKGMFKGFGVGGVQRWEDKSIIGYYGKSSGNNTTIPGYMDLSDVTKPIYDDSNTYTDLWASYTRKIFKDKVRMKIQLNVANVFEDGHLQTTGVNYDGSAYAFRIVDPRTFTLSASFDL